MIIAGFVILACMGLPPRGLGATNRHGMSKGYSPCHIEPGRFVIVMTEADEEM
jgi:hypothetical protein